MDTLEDSALWSQLANAVALVGKQDQIVWAIFGIFWAANAVLVVALFTTGALPGTGTVSGSLRRLSANPRTGRRAEPVPENALGHSRRAPRFSRSIPCSAADAHRQAS